MLASSFDEPHEAQFLTSFLINDTVAIDAGSVGFQGHPSEQAKIDHVFLTHSHADHVCSLPMLLTNAYDERSEGVTVYGHEHTLGSLRTDVFNDRVWPDLLRLAGDGRPFMRLRRLEPDQEIRANGLRVTPVLVDHLVPTLGYIVEDQGATVVFCSDTGPTDKIWKVARGKPNLTALFLGASFPDEMATLAGTAAHLTPALFAGEVAKLGADVDVLAVHIKPGCRELVVRELEALDLPGLQIAEAGREYRF